MNSNTNNEFANYLKDYMREHDLNQSELASKVGLGRSTASLYITGRRIPTASTQRKIKQILESDFSFDCRVAVHNADDLNINIKHAPKDFSILLERILANPGTRRLLEDYMKKLEEVL